MLDEFVRGGVTTVCLSPGARSTPLVAAAAAHPGLRIVTHVDERGAAFFCLGHGRASGIPAIWLTTSGTAVANGFPAVIEAAMDHVPLLCLTADRPEELRGTGANQTIRQPGIFGDYPRFQADLEAPSIEGSSPGTPPERAREVARQALQASIGLPAGPVHLNCPFRKPLEPSDSWPEASRPGDPPAAITATSDVTALAASLEDTAFGVILAGRIGKETAAAARALAEKLSWPILPDICSNLRLGRSGPRVIRYADLLAGRPLPAPEAVIQIGRMPVSQKLTRALAAWKPRVWAVLADGRERIDPHGVVTHRLNDARPATDALNAELKTKPIDERAGRWIEADQRIADRLPGELNALSEPAAAATVAAHLTSRDALVLASSMPVRDVNTFAGPGARPAITVSNRGASGIDGTLATAAGVSDVLSRRGTGGRTVLLIGDLAFLHDLNSLGLIRGRQVTVVVVNNDGGGIFSFLPVADHQDLFEPYFGVAHGLQFESAAALYGIPHHQPATLAELDDLLDRTGESRSPAIIEVRTSREENAEEHRRLQRTVGTWLD